MILLDTHVLVWLVAGSHRVGQRSQDEIQAAWNEGTAAVSSFTFWEMAMLHARGRLELGVPPRSLHRNLVADGLRVVPVDDETAIRGAELGAEGLRADPADLIITATAILGGYRLATADRNITMWAEQTRLVAVLDPAA